MAYIYSTSYKSDDDDVDVHTGKLPDYDVGDLLLMIVHKDSTSGDPVTVPTGWTSVIILSEANEFGMFKKIAVANEPHPVTSSTDNDAWQSLIISIKNSSGLGVLNYDIWNSDYSVTIPRINDPQTQLGNLKLLITSVSGIGGCTIENFGKRLLNEESLGVAMSVHVDTIYDTSITDPFEIRMSTTREGVLYQLEILDDGAGVYEGKVNNNITIIDTVTEGANIQESSILTIAGKTVTNGTLSEQEINGGFFPFQTGARLKGIKGEELSAFELLLNSPIDLSIELMQFHCYPQVSKYQPAIGQGQDGTFIYLIDSLGNYKVWNVDASDAQLLNLAPLWTFTLDPYSSSYFDSLGTLDLTDIAIIGMGQRSRTITTYLLMSRIYSVGKTEIFGGTPGLEMSLEELFPHQDGAYYRPTLKQGTARLIQSELQIGNGINTTLFNEDSIVIEYPTQYDLLSRDLFYNMSDSRVGVSFLLTANCIVNLSSITLQSPTPFYFKKEDELGTISIKDSIIRGATPIIISNNIDFKNTTFDKCGTIQSVSPTFTDCIISNSKDTYSIEFDNLSNVNGLKVTNYAGKFALFIPATITGSITLTGILFDGTGTDIFWAGTSGTLDVQLSNGSNASTSSSAGGIVNILTSATLTLTGLVDFTEVRIYTNDLSEELFGLEDTTNGEIVFNYSAIYTDAVITIFHINYDPIRLIVQLNGIDTSIPIQQQSDRWKI